MMVLGWVIIGTDRRDGRTRDLAGLS